MSAFDLKRTKRAQPFHPPCDQVTTTFEFHVYSTLVVPTCHCSVFHGSNLAEDWSGSGSSRRFIYRGGHNMKKIVVAAVVASWCVPSATLAGERVGDAALGALSGAVVLGPVGAVAGAVIGYTAGPSIAESWGLRRSDPRHGGRSG